MGLFLIKKRKVILENKHMLLALIVIAILIVLFFTGNKSVEHTIIINAKPDAVWKAITETNNYREWNPVMELLEGEIKEGNKVKYRFTQDEKNISEIASTVKKIVPNELLNQGGGLPFVITFNHKYILEQKEEKTLLTINEVYKGVYVNFWNPKPVELAYKRLNEAIKKKAESL